MSWDVLFRVLAVVSAFNFPKRDFMLQCYRAKLVPFVWRGVLYMQCVEKCGFLIRRASKFCGDALATGPQPLMKTPFILFFADPWRFCMEHLLASPHCAAINLSVQLRRAYNKGVLAMAHLRDRTVLVFNGEAMTQHARECGLCLYHMAQYSFVCCSKTHAVCYKCIRIIVKICAECRKPFGAARYLPACHNRMKRALLNIK